MSDCCHETTYCSHQRVFICSECGDVWNHQDFAEEFESLNADHWSMWSLKEKHRKGQEQAEARAEKAEAERDEYYNKWLKAEREKEAESMAKEELKAEVERLQGIIADKAKELKGEGRCVEAETLVTTEIIGRKAQRGGE